MNDRQVLIGLREVGVSSITERPHNIYIDGQSDENCDEQRRSHIARPRAQRQEANEKRGGTQN